MPINDAGTYKLSSITVTGAEEGAYMDPEIEYVQQLNPNGSAVIARYTYVSKDYLLDIFGEEDYETYAGAVGWWKWSKDIFTYIEEGEYTDMVAKEDVPLAPGFSFLGFLQGNELDFNFPAATK